MSWMGEGSCSLSPSQSFGLLLVTADMDWSQTSTKGTTEHSGYSETPFERKAVHLPLLGPQNPLRTVDSEKQARHQGEHIHGEQLCGCSRHCPMAWGAVVLIRWRRAMRNQNTREVCFRMIWDQDQFMNQMNQWEWPCEILVWGRCQDWSYIPYKLHCLSYKDHSGYKKVKWEDAYKVPPTETDGLLTRW